MKEIEEGIHEIHAQAREQKDKQETQQDQEMAGKVLSRIVQNESKWRNIQSLVKVKNSSPKKPVSRLSVEC